MDGLVASGLGWLGVFFGVTWPLMRERRTMLTAQALLSVAFGLHFWMIDAPAGAMMNLIAGVQALLAIPLGRVPQFRLVYLATLPAIAVGVTLSWTGAASLFAGIGFGLVSVARWQIAPLRFRWLMLSAIPCWAVHNVLAGSAPALTCDAIAFATSAWGIWRTRAALPATAKADQLA